MSGNVLVLCKGSTTIQEMGDTLGALLHSLHITSPVVSMCVFWQEYSLVKLKHPRHCMCWALFPTATTLGNPTLVMQIGLRRLHGCDQTDNLTR